MEIREIGVTNLRIPPTNIFNVDVAPPIVYQIPVPVTVQLGIPIIEMPGCVKDHPDGDEQLTVDDPKGTKILCTNEYPSYDAMDYTPEDLIYNYETPVPPVAPPPETPPTPEVPADAIPKTVKETECPGPNAPRVGDVAQNKKERVSGFELQIVNGQEVCVTLYEDIPWQAQYLPAPQIVATTAGIAVVATSSALLAKPLADLLLKVVKPTVKKVLKKIATLRGKKIPVQSARERVAEQRQRNQAVKALRSVRPLKK
tara:strand:- start:78 stop:848 length:771 start_codon:yes stop_codon:yes gene_type:complete